MTEREQLLQTLDEAHNRLIAAALNAAKRGMKDPWGPREILAHVVGWEALVIDRLPRLLAGEEPLAFDVDATNVAMITLIGEQPIEIFCAMLPKVHQRFLDIPEVKEDTSFIPGHRVYERVHLAIEHSLEHAEVLECWQA